MSTDTPLAAAYASMVQSTKVTAPPTEMVTRPLFDRVEKGIFTFAINKAPNHPELSLTEWFHVGLDVVMETHAFGHRGSVTDEGDWDYFDLWKGLVSPLVVHRSMRDERGRGELFVRHVWLRNGMDSRCSSGYVIESGTPGKRGTYAATVAAWDKFHLWSYDNYVDLEAKKRNINYRMPPEVASAWDLFVAQVKS